MKKVILFVLIFGAGRAFSQTTTQGSVPTKLVTGYTDIRDKVTTEGVYYPQYGAFTYGYWSGQTIAGGMSVASPAGVPAIPMGSAFWPSFIHVSSNFAVGLQSLTGSRYIGNYGLGALRFMSANTITVPMDGTLIHAGQQLPSLSITDVPEANPQSTPATTTNNMAYLKSTTTVVSPANRTYSITVSIINSTGSSVTNPTIADSLPRGCNYYSASGTNWGFVTSGKKNYTGTYTGTMNVGDTATYTLVVQSAITVNVYSCLSGYFCSDDITDPYQPIVWCGTSITQGNTGLTDYRQNYTILFKNWLRDSIGIDSRIINRGISGTQSTQMEDLRANNGYYNFKQEPKIWVIEHGINDVAQGIDTTTTKKNELAMITMVRRRWPNCVVFVLAGFPTGNATYEALLVNTRLAQQHMVQALSVKDQNYVAFVNTGNLWNPVTQDNIYTVDQIHLTPTARILVNNAIKSVYVSKFINTVLP